jgi:hypothetical protein
MVTKEIKICGKEITLAYCYATEISYKILSDEDINEFCIDISEHIKQNKMPDIRKTIFLVLAAMNAYYEYKGEKPPISDKDLMNEAAPQDIGLALGTLISLRSEFYHVPSGEPSDDKNEESTKNA